MKLSRIDQIALNGATGEHYKYVEVAERVADLAYDYRIENIGFHQLKANIMKILIEEFPNDETR